MQRLKNIAFQSPIQIYDHRLNPKKAIEVLEPLLTEDRISCIEDVLESRTRNIAVVLENLLDLGNVSAVMRSMEAMGLHILHNIENEKLLKSNRVTRGADKWLDIVRWKNTEACIKQLKQDGYKIVATSLSPQSVPISEIDFTDKTAICFGSEKDGLSDSILSQSDYQCILPMSGFSQSYNISVATALSLQHIQQQRRKVLGSIGDLDKEDKELMRAIYYLMSAPKPLKRLLDNLFASV